MFSSDLERENNKLAISNFAFVIDVCTSYMKITMENNYIILVLEID